MRPQASEGERQWRREGLFTLHAPRREGRASRRRLAASNLAELGVIASGHATDIAPERFVAFSGGAQRRIEVRTQRAGNEGEHSCIDAGRLAAPEERRWAHKKPKPRKCTGSERGAVGR